MAHIFADAKYSLWINGRYVLNGPARFNPKGPEFDSIELAGSLRPGNNTVAVLVYQHNDRGDSGQHIRHPGGLTMWIEGSGNDIATDTSWKASSNTRFQPAKVRWENFTERIDARREYDCLSDRFDDSAWDAATRIDGKLWGPLAPRTIPLLAETSLKAKLPFTLPATTGSFDVAFDKAAVVAVQIDFEAEAGTSVEIFGNTFVARSGRQVYRTLDTFGFGINRRPVVRITASKPIVVHDLQFINRVYPFTTGSFTSSDARLDCLWAASINTILNVSEDGYHDCPWERAEWMGDIATVEYPITRVALVGPDQSYGDPRLLRSALKHIGESQLPDGRIRAHAPSDRMDIHGYIEDYSCLWVMALRQYLDDTGDLAFVQSQWPALTRQMALFLSLKQPDGLIKRREFVIFDNPLKYTTLEGATLNAFIYKALRESAYLATALGKTDEAAAYQKQAAELASAFNALLWDGAAYKASTTRIASGAPAWYANMIALAMNVVPADRAAGVRQGLLANAAGLSDTLMPETHHWLFQALYEMDSDAADQTVLDCIRKRWSQTYDASNVTRVTDESFGPRNFHNFGAAAAYDLAASVLGVTVDGPISNNRLLINPRLGDLASASGTVISRHGPVPVSWKREGAGLSFSFTVPAGKQARVVIPAAKSPAALTLDGHSQALAIQGRSVVFQAGAGAHRGSIDVRQ